MNTASERQLLTNQCKPRQIVQIVICNLLIQPFGHWVCAKPTRTSAAMGVIPNSKFGLARASLIPEVRSLRSPKWSSASITGYFLNVIPYTWSKSTFRRLGLSSVSKSPHYPGSRRQFLEFSEGSSKPPYFFVSRPLASSPPHIPRLSELRTRCSPGPQLNMEKFIRIGPAMS